MPTRDAGWLPPFRLFHECPSQLWIVKYDSVFEADWLHEFNLLSVRRVSSATPQTDTHNLPAYPAA